MTNKSVGIYNVESKTNNNIKPKNMTFRRSLIDPSNKIRSIE